MSEDDRMSRTPTRGFYEAFYEEGGWRYGTLREWWWHWRHMVRRLGLPRGGRMLEAACGTGFHTNLFARMGFDCVGFDTCETATRIARETYPHREFHCCDAKGPLPFPQESFDVVVTRGCSLYHYDLSAPGPHDATRNLMRYLKPGGVFVLIIVSDLSGRQDPVKIWQNRLADYSAHFRQHTPNCRVEWHKGVVICGARKEN